MPMGRAAAKAAAGAASSVRRVMRNGLVTDSPYRIYGLMLA
jgi:hypothetical protein